MFRTILHVGEGSVATERIVRRHLSFKSVKTAIRRHLEPRSKLPYNHVCQVGDPVMRTPALPVEPEMIAAPEFKSLIKHMKDVMRKHHAMGLSANQIGLSYQIFLMEVTKEHLEKFDDAYRKSRQMELVPLQVFVNPTMKVIDYATVKHTEECLSILGYSAVVPRAQTIRIDALDIFGKPFVWDADGWAARVAQHEMDHLQGKMFVDRMDPSTFACTFWSTVNMRGGNVGLKYYPQSWLRRVLLYR